MITGPGESESVEARIRPLYVDGKPKEFVVGTAHDITDRLFVVQRIARVNDSLPQENSAAPRWQWQIGGWSVVDRLTGHISPITLPEFDPYLSAASWYRDYVAYCGVSDDGHKLYAVAIQMGHRKPFLRKVMGENSEEGTQAALCPAPVWQRQPARVTFAPKNAPAFTCTVHTRAVEEESDGEEESAE